MRTLFMTVLLVMMPLGGIAQTAGDGPWEDYLEGMMTDEDEAPGEELAERLEELAQHPMDINRARREDLELLPFLSAQQVEDIMAYQHSYGPMKSLSELMMIASLDYQCRRLLGCFVYAGGDGDRREKADAGRTARHGLNELTATGRIPLYERRGDREGYLGYGYRHWLRYQYSCGDGVKLGMVASQDAGEPFFASRNKSGYDYYSLYLQLRHLGRVESLVTGRYRVSQGMGLLMNGSMGTGKTAMLENLGRPTNLIRAHSSRSEAGYLQGAAATVNAGRGWKLTGYASYRGMDATLNKAGDAATIITSGYHRTETEMDRKHNLMITTMGGGLHYDGGGMHGGLNAVYSHLSRRLSPDTTALYRRHYPQGSDLLNVSADYGYVNHRLALSGETALSRNGGLATINSLSLQTGGGLRLMGVQRLYSFRYQSLYASSLSDGGRVQNESGVLIGVSWQPRPDLKATLYADYAYHPWARYQASQASHGWDWLLQTTYTRKSWTLSARYRLRLRQRDNEQKTALEPRREHRARVTADYRPNGRWSSRTQADLNFAGHRGLERGWMVSQTAGYSGRWLRLNAGVAYFSTDGYDSRVYLYEQGPLYTYAMGQFQGKGLRWWLMVRATAGKRLSLTAKLGRTRYFDRDVIGSGYQQVDGSAMTDLDVQARWKF